MFYFNESPRILFEHSDWFGITNIFTSLYDENDINKFYKTEDFMIKFEENERKLNEERKNNIIYNLERKYSKIYESDYFKELYNSIKVDSIKNKPTISFTPNELLKNPSIFYRIMYFEKKISREIILGGSTLLLILFN